jgi:hypothetical protein
LLDGRFGHTHTINSAMREWLYERKRQEPTLRAPDLAAALTREFGVPVAAGHVNYLLRKVGLTSPPGRPYKASAAPAPPAATTVAAAPPDCRSSLPRPGARRAFFPSRPRSRSWGSRRSSRPRCARRSSSIKRPSPGAPCGC